MKRNQYKTPFLYNIGDVVNNLEIIDAKRIPDKQGYPHKKYKYKCLTCGFNCSKHYYNGVLREELWVPESRLKNGVSCSVCSNTIVVPGINDICTTESWMIDFFANGKDDAIKYAKKSNKRVDMVCPQCGTLHKNKTISNLYQNKSIACGCSRGASYGEKYVMKLLQILNQNFIYQVSKYSNWFIDKNTNYRYDFGIKDLNLIIETHGKQHYEQCNFYGHSTTLNDVQSNDINKYTYAMSHGVLNYIVIDCRYSSAEFIKKSIIDSKLLRLFNVTSESIDWDLCGNFASNSLMKDIFQYKENHPLLTNIQIGKIYGLSGSTVGKYLNSAKEFGFIGSYDKYNSLRAINNKCDKTNKIVGISYNSNRKKYIAVLKIDGRYVLHKTFDTEEQAIVSRLKAELEYFGGLAPQKYLFEQYGINKEDKNEGRNANDWQH